MQYLKVRKELAEQAKRKLVRESLLDKHAAIEHSDSYVLFPMQDISRATIKKLFGRGADVIERAGKETSKKNPNYRESLRDILTNGEYEEMVKGYDLLGNIAIIDVPESLMKKEKRIARVIMQIHSHVKTVVAKEGAVSGKFRTRKFRIVAGEKNYIAMYKENGCTFRFDVRKTFFSNRLGHERMRIVNLSKKKEDVAVLFGGIGPFTIEIAKANPKASVVNVELNPYAHKLALENIKLNKVKNATAVKKDVKAFAKGKHKNFDRIIVPMPTTSLEYLDSIRSIAKKRALVHLYVFAHLDEGLNLIKKRLSDHAKDSGYKIKIVNTRIARPYSAKGAEFVVDYELRR